jgi:hypothetical protein
VTEETHVAFIFDQVPIARTNAHLIVCIDDGRGLSHVERGVCGIEIDGKVAVHERVVIVDRRGPIDYFPIIWRRGRIAQKRRAQLKSHVVIIVWIDPEEKVERFVSILEIDRFVMFVHASQGVQQIFAIGDQLASRIQIHSKFLL